MFGLNEAVRNEVINTNITNPTHHEICCQLVQLAEDFNKRGYKGAFLKGGSKGFTHTKSGVVKPFPMSFLVYFAVGKEAHKEGAFNKGYINIDVEKAKTILNMLKFFGVYNENPSLSRNDKVVHAVTKYYDKVSTKLVDFENCLRANWTPYNGTPKTMKEITIGLKIDVE